MLMDAQCECVFWYVFMCDCGLIVWHPSLVLRVGKCTES